MLFDNTLLIRLYAEMLKIRLTEETIAERYSEWKMRCPTHLSTGQEAVAAGVCAALRKDDFVMSTHRCHAHYLAKGGDLNRMIAELYGKSTGCSSGKGGSMHLIDQSAGFLGSTSIVGNSIPVSAGLGLAIKLQNTDQVSCVFFGDAAAETGVFYESINFAILKELPVLFICENNLYSVYSPLKVRQPEGRKIFEMVKALGIRSEFCDGNDVLEVYERALHTVNSVRKGNGPYFLEFSTYRWREHCGPFFDNNLGYRTESEFQNWLKKDPIRKMEIYLVENSLLTESQLEDMKRRQQSLVDEAFDFAERSPFPESKDAFFGVYA